MKLYKQAHTVYKTQYHIVWVTRFRRRILIPGVASYLKIKLHEVRKYYPDWYFTMARPPYIGIKVEVCNIWENI